MPTRFLVRQSTCYGSSLTAERMSILKSTCLDSFAPHRTHRLTRLASPSVALPRLVAELYPEGPCILHRPASKATHLSVNRLAESTLDGQTKRGGWHIRQESFKSLVGCPVSATLPVKTEVRTDANCTRTDGRTMQNHRENAYARPRVQNLWICLCTKLACQHCS